MEILSYIIWVDPAYSQRTLLVDMGERLGRSREMGVGDAWTSAAGFEGGGLGREPKNAGAPRAGKARTQALLCSLWEEQSPVDIFVLAQGDPF